jgi:hypothetical protein
MGELDTAGSDSAAAPNIMKPMMPTWINSSLHRGSLPGVLATFGYGMEQPRGSDSMMRGGIATSAGIRPDFVVSWVCVRTLSGTAILVWRCCNAG